MAQVRPGWLRNAELREDSPYGFGSFLRKIFAVDVAGGPSNATLKKRISELNVSLPCGVLYVDHAASRIIFGISQLDLQGDKNGSSGKITARAGPVPGLFHVFRCLSDWLPDSIKSSLRDEFPVYIEHDQECLSASTLMSVIREYITNMESSGVVRNVQEHESRGISVFSNRSQTIFVGPFEIRLGISNAFFQRFLFIECEAIAKEATIVSETLVEFFNLVNAKSWAVRLDYGGTSGQVRCYASHDVTSVPSVPAFQKILHVLLQAVVDAATRFLLGALLAQKGSSITEAFSRSMEIKTAGLPTPAAVAASLGDPATASAQPTVEPDAFKTQRDLCAWKPLALWDIDLQDAHILHSASDSTTWAAGFFGAPVMVRSISKHRHHTAESISAFYEHVVMLRDLRHPYVLEPLGWAEDADGWYLLSHRIPCNLLAVVIASAPLLTFPIRARILLQIADALAYLHSRGWAHGALKPSHIYLTESLDVRISNLLSTAFPDPPVGFPTTSTSVPVSSGMSSPSQTMPPEETIAFDVPLYLEPNRRSTKADVLAFGLLTYFILTCRFPFHSSLASMDQLAASIQHTRPPIPRSSDVPGEYVELIEACWHLDPSRRPCAQRVARTLRRLCVLYPPIQQDSLSLSQTASQLLWEHKEIRLLGGRYELENGLHPHSRRLRCARDTRSSKLDRSFVALQIFASHGKLLPERTMLDKLKGAGVVKMVEPFAFEDSLEPEGPVWQFLVLERGEYDLRTLLFDTAGPLDLHQVALLCLHVATALDRIHSAGLAHLSLTPAVIVSFRGKWKLSSLSFARPLTSRPTPEPFSHDPTTPTPTHDVTTTPDPTSQDPSAPWPGSDSEPEPWAPTSPSTSTLTPKSVSRTARVPDLGSTDAGAAASKLQYVSPECATEPTRPASPATDAWALGAILYEAAVGRPLIVDVALRDDKDLFVMDRDQCVHWLGSLSSVETTALRQLPPELAELLKALLSVNPNDRPALASVVSSAFASSRTDPAKALAPRLDAIQHSLQLLSNLQLSLVDNSAPRIFCCFPESLLRLLEDATEDIKAAPLKALDNKEVNLEGFFDSNFRLKLPDVTKISALVRRAFLLPLDYISDRFVLKLMCEYQDWHFVDGDRGYMITEPHKFIKAVAPWASRVLKLMTSNARLLPMPIPVQILDILADAMDKASQGTLDGFNKVKAAALDNKPSTSSSSSSAPTTTDLGSIDELEGAALREFHVFLAKIDPNHKWAGLVRAQVDGQVLWVCPHHAAIIAGAANSTAKSSRSPARVPSKSSQALPQFPATDFSSSDRSRACVIL